MEKYIQKPKTKPKNKNQKPKNFYKKNNNFKNTNNFNNQVSRKLNKQQRFQGLMRNNAPFSSLLNTYQKSLLLPALDIKPKIPSSGGDESICVHKTYATTATVNAVGDFALIVNLNELCVAAGIDTCSYYCNDVNYRAGGITFDSMIATPLATNLISQLTVNTINQLRLVSGCVTITSTSPALTRTGCMYGSLIKRAALPAVANNAAPLNRPMPVIIDVSGTPYYKTANVSLGEGLTGIFLPVDEDDYKFANPNLSLAARHNTNEMLYYTVIIGSGLVANSTIRIEYAINAELIPTTGAVLMGFETKPAPYNPIPLQTQKQFLMDNFKDYIVRTVHNSNPMQDPAYLALKTGPKRPDAYITDGATASWTDAASARPNSFYPFPRRYPRREDL